MDRNIYTAKLISMDGATQIPKFGKLKRVDGTTQEFVSGTFRGCKFQSCLLAKYFISVNNCSCTADNKKLRNRSFTVS